MGRPKFDFNGKLFKLLDNSGAGKANDQTIFNYEQQGDLVTADYSGGPIKYGKIIARLEGDKLNMLYQCVTSNDELLAGKAKADITLNDEGKIRLRLHWQWLENELKRGVSEYLEI